MARIENTSERQYDISIKVGDDVQNVSVPRGNGEQGPAKVNGSVEVSDEFLKAAQAHGAVAAWFASGDLIVGKAAAIHKAPVDEEKHPHRR